MFGDWIKAILMRDLRCLKRQLEAYADEDDIWKTPPGTTNSAGTLALHLVGNIRHFIGAQLGHSTYKRDRDAEFQSRNVSREQMLKDIDMAIIGVEHTLPTVTEEVFAQPYGLKIGDATVTTGDFMVHLAAHLAYHLGQIDYHRRIVTGEAGKVGAVSPLELATATK